MVAAKKKITEDQTFCSSAKIADGSNDICAGQTKITEGQTWAKQLKLKLESQRGANMGQTEMQLTRRSRMTTGDHGQPRETTGDHGREGDGWRPRETMGDRGRP